MPPARKLFKKMRGGGDLYMSGVDKNGISKFIPGDIGGLVFWAQADTTKCTFRPVEEYVKTISPSIGENILKQYGDTPSQSVLVGINSLIDSEPNSLVRLEIDTTGRTRFPTFISEPEKLDVISLQDMIDPTNTSQRKEKLCTKSELDISSSSMSVYAISTNIKITFNDNLKTLIVSVIDVTAPVTNFSEIIVFSRKLSEAEHERMEGYLAYRKNEQYLLNFNHEYLPSMEPFSFIKDISKPIGDTELAITTGMEKFDTAVATYRSHLPTAEILQKAPPLKEKATAALRQLSVIRQSVVKGALLARKQKTETVAATFDAINKLSLYSEPFTAEIFNSKLGDLRGVMAELEAYMKSLENVDTDIAAAVDQNNMSDQIKKRGAATSAEPLKDQMTMVELKALCIKMRDNMKPINSIGKAKYEALYKSFATTLKSLGETFGYYSSTVKSSWSNLVGNFETLDRQIASGDWLKYDASLNTEKTVTNRNNVAYHIQYKDPYLDRIQTLYEQIRNQIIEGDVVYLKNEIDYIVAMFDSLMKRVDKKQVSPLSKKMFNCFLKKKLKQIITYEANFKKLNTVLGDATNELLRILSLNKKYNTSQIKLEKEYPIPILFSFKDVAQKVRYIRKVNKHDHLLSMIEYIVTNADGTIQYIDEVEREVDLIFPSVENISKNGDDNFFTRKLPFCDDSGIPLLQKIIILAAYKKTEGILDSISKTQVLPKFIHIVDSLFEVPRDAENGIYEIVATGPQMPILLPKYAMADGTFFICVNVGDIPIHIQIPGFTEDSYDLIGPDETCMYIYTGVADSTSTFYGRVQWIENRIPYDTIYDVPRSSLCCKLTDLSKYVYMNTEKMPLFDRNGFLVEAIPDKNSFVYDIDDAFHAFPYKVNIGLTEMKLSDLEINEDWGEKRFPSEYPTKLRVLSESGTGFGIFCSTSGTPAINEFGYTKYLRTPLLQVNDKIVTRSATSDSAEVELSPDVSIIQYGRMVPNMDIFGKVFRSNFVKPAGSANTTFFHVNSVGYPLVSPTNTYIQVENLTFEPPYYVKYTENFVTEYAYIPEESPYFVASKNVLEIKTYPMIFLRTAEERDAAEILLAIKIISYRYNTGGAYIQFAITKLKTELSFCNSARSHFSGATVDSTVELLGNCIRDITGHQADYLTYKPTITAIKTRNLIGDKTNDERIVMDTFDLKMKDTLGKVYKSFTKGLAPIKFFRCILKKLDKIRAEIKDIRDVKAIEIENSIINIQTVIKNQSLLQGGTINSDLTSLLNECTEKKVEFDGILKTLENALHNIPPELRELEDWVDSQEILIDHATKIYREILDMDNIHTVAIFTQQLTNNLRKTTKLLEENADKVRALIEYKKKIAKWIEVYPDAAELKKYTEQLPIPTSATSLKGYSISFLVFEEVENPLISRDWYPLIDTGILSKSTRTRISIGLNDPMKAFIEKYKKYYQDYDISANVPEPSTYERSSEAELKSIVDASNAATNSLIAGAVDAEEALMPIFNEYKGIRSDLRVEIQKVLDETARDIQAKWIDCTGKRTAIQTNLKLLDPYLNESQIERKNKIIVDMDNLFASDKLSAVDEVQRSLKVSDYYVNMNYIKMVEINTRWGELMSFIKYINDNLTAPQDSMESLQREVTSKLSEEIKSGRDEIESQYNTVKAGITDGSKLKDLTNMMDPLIAAMGAKNATDLPSAIELMRSIKDIQQKLVQP